ncbi:MAG: hypothetical protein KDK27_13785, partial [Leptospiraceae bacterium]|nr:hypothetical protein [Leptospiraceae bacterium]
MTIKISMRVHGATYRLVLYWLCGLLLLATVRATILDSFQSDLSAYLPGFADLLPRPVYAWIAADSQQSGTGPAANHNQTRTIRENAHIEQGQYARTESESIDPEPIESDSIDPKPIDSKPIDTEPIESNMDSDVEASVPLLQTGTPDANRLHLFYKRLAQLDQGEQTVVRVLHYGDSVLWGDNVTRRIKANLQERFGDGGRGLVNVVDDPAIALVDHTNQTERHAFRRHSIPLEWFSMQPLPYPGFTGYTWEALQPEAISIHHAPDNVAAWRHIRVIVRALPGSNTHTHRKSENAAVTLHAPDTNPVLYREKNVALENRDCALVEFRTPPVRHIEVAAPGATGLIDGIVLESRRGLSYSAVIRMSMHLAWLSAIPFEQRACGLRAYNPDLLIFQFGINESYSLQSRVPGFDLDVYERQLRRVLSETRRALPDTPILIIGPYERLAQTHTGLSEPDEHRSVRRIQERVAADLGLAFFDAYRALGGPGSMRRLVAEGRSHTDYTHITVGGGNILADRFSSAVLDDYARFRDPDANQQATSAPVEQQDRQSDFLPPALHGVARFLNQSIMPGTGATAIQFNSRAFAYFLLTVVLGATWLL